MNNETEKRHLVKPTNLIIRDDELYLVSGIWKTQNGKAAYIVNEAKIQGGWEERFEDDRSVFWFVIKNNIPAHTVATPNVVSQEDGIYHYGCIQNFGNLNETDFSESEMKSENKPQKIHDLLDAGRRSIAQLKGASWDGF